MAELWLRILNTRIAHYQVELMIAYKKYVIYENKWCMTRLNVCNILDIQQSTF
jgi:hypothetical protein